METQHRILFDDSRNMRNIEAESVDLIVTSPPYPMIEMWDDMFSKQSEEIAGALGTDKPQVAFELMHRELDKVWKRCYAVLKKGGVACINIGDATRKVDGSFKLYPNHARILCFCSEIGFHTLPAILWRKQSNKPNKFMGSGMLPAGAYVTLEHEYILILRKGLKRRFVTEEEKLNRLRSAYFWAERNTWFSDVWTDLKGNQQTLNGKEKRARSGAYPFELPYRLISMFSAHDDTVLDPYLGTGTSTVAAMALGRNSIGIEIDSSFKPTIENNIQNSVRLGKQAARKRIAAHLGFVSTRKKMGLSLPHTNEYYGFPIMTRQEVLLRIPILESVRKQKEGLYLASYAKASQKHLQSR
jgi:DNA modification methylase